MESLTLGDRSEPGRPGAVKSDERVYVCQEGFLPESPRLPWACQLQTCPANSALEIGLGSAGEWLRERLEQHGAVLLRGLPIRDAQDFEAALGLFSVTPGNDLAGDSRRRAVRGLVFESSRLEPHHVLDLHNEATYKVAPPRRLFFCCCRAAADGGETPIGRSRKVFERLDPKIREEFMRKGVMYVRHLDSATSRAVQSWQDSFNTDDRLAVESECRKQGIDFEWYGEDGLKLTQVRPAAVLHPVTQRWCWVNQLHLAHRSRWIRTGVVADGLEDSHYPTCSFYGDGSEIPLDVLGHIRRCWSKEEQIFFWQEGDILVLDNLRVAHGRKPYYGTRQLLLALSNS